MKTFKMLGLLLTYPQQPLYDAFAAMRKVLQSEGMLPPKQLQAVTHFLQQQSARDLLDAQEEYVDTFDRGRAHCLHLFEHIHGESRDRGQAMVDLSETYADKGLVIANNELPDYLPLFMEYLALCPFAEARSLLSEAVDVIAMLGTKLKHSRSSYAVVFDAIVALSSVKPDTHRVQAALAAAVQDPQSLDELDAQWKEAAAFGGDPAKEAVDHCHQCPSYGADIPIAKKRGNKS